MILLAAVIGLPCVGKSSICKFLTDNITDYKIVHLQYDIFIPDDFLTLNELEVHQWKLCRNALLEGLDLFLELMINKRDKITLFPQAQSKWEDIKYKSFNFLYDSYFANETRNLIFLLDDNFFYRSMRYELFKIAKKHSLSFATILCSCEKDILFERFANRQNNNVTIDSLMRIDRLFEIPKSSNWEKWFYEIRTDLPYDSWYVRLQPFLEECFRNPFDLTTDFEQIRISTNDSCVSTTHKLDVMLRKCVSEVMKTNGSQIDGNQLAAVKRQIMDESKNDAVIISQLLYGESVDSALQEMKIMFVSKLTVAVMKETENRKQEYIH